MQAVFDADLRAFTAKLRIRSADCTASAASLVGQAEVAIVTVLLDADMQPINETFYPYYGSAVKQKYLPTPGETFQSTFTPYTVISLLPAPVQFEPGYPTASQITSNTFRLQAHLGRPVTLVQFAVVAIADLMSASEDAIAALFAARTSVVLLASGQAHAVSDTGNDYEASIGVGNSRDGGLVSVAIRLEDGCNVQYAVLQDIVLPDTQAPDFLSLEINAPCNSLLPGTDIASMQVHATLSEAAEVRALPFSVDPGHGHCCLQPAADLITGHAVPAPALPNLQCTVKCV